MKLLVKLKTNKNESDYLKKEPQRLGVDFECCLEHAQICLLALAHFDENLKQFFRVGHFTKTKTI